MRSRCARAVALMGILPALLIGCGTPSASPPPQPAETTPATAPAEATPPPAAARAPAAEVTRVVIDNFAYSPRELTVAPGTRVTWVNHDDVPHTVTGSRKPRAFDSRAMDTDDAFSFEFTAPGTYDYFCAVHPHMTGKVIVKSSPPTREE